MFDQTPVTPEWQNVQKQDKGVVDASASFDKKAWATSSYEYQLRTEFLQQPIKDFAFSLRFCINPDYKYNYITYCMATKRLLVQRKECLNQFCSLCCGIARDMLIQQANKYTTASALGLTLTPGQNIIEKLIGDDERIICSLRCNMQYPVPQPHPLPSPPLIKDLGENENTENGPVAWSCTDIMMWNTEIQDELRSGYFQIKIKDFVYKAQCDIHNGGWTLFFNQTTQGNIDLTDVTTLVDPVEDVTNTTLFPQHKPDASTRAGGEQLIPIENKHMPLNKVMPDENNEVAKQTKIKALWFFCAAWTIDPNITDWQVEHLQSFTTQDAGALHAAFTEDRSQIGNKWLSEAGDLNPNGQEYGDMNDDDDTPSFYLLWKFNPGQFFQQPNKLGNLFMKEELENKMTDKISLVEEGFHNTLFSAKSLVNPDEKASKWSVKTDENPSSPDPSNINNGIWNCDSDQTKDESLTKTFLHQVQFQTYTPTVHDFKQELEQRATKYKLWPKS